MEQVTVLGLSINTRMLGLAIVCGNLLVDYHISLRKEPWTLIKRDLILTRLQPWCTSYSINSIALSIPYENQSSIPIKELLESIKVYFNNQKITLCSYPPQTLHVFCEETQTKTKKEAMRKLTELYPELTTYYNKEQRNKNKYYVKLFEAVAVATVHSRKLRKKRK